MFFFQVTYDGELWLCHYIGMKYEIRLKVKVNAQGLLPKPGAKNHSPVAIGYRIWLKLVANLTNNNLILYVVYQYQM